MEKFCSYFYFLMISSQAQIIFCSLQTIELTSNSNDSELIVSTVSRQSRQSKPNADLQFPSKILPIPGTELYSGVFYKLTIGRFPNGTVTWAPDTNNDEANYVQVDLTPNHLSHYAASQKGEPDAEWILNPTEHKNYFTLENRGFSINKSIHALVTWSSDIADAGGHHVVIYSTPNEVGYLSNKNGKWRDGALWKIESAGGGLYRLVNKHLAKGTFTWTFKKYGEYSHYMQIDTNTQHTPFYQTGGQWFNDAVFKFTPVELQLGNEFFAVKKDSPSPDAAGDSDSTEEHR